MGGPDAADLYTGFVEPLFPYPYLVGVVAVTLPIAAFCGFRLGKLERRRKKYDRARPEEIPGSTSLGAMLALLGLLLGFAFSTTLGWHEDRQTALVEEAAAIGTAFLNADLLPESGRTELQRQLLEYARTRIVVESDIRSMEAWQAALDRTLDAQEQLWPTARRAMGDATSDPIRALVAGSVTAVLDAHTRRIAAAAEQIPPAANLMIFLAAVLGIFVAGNRAALQGRSLTWRTFAFAGLLAVVIIVITDLDRGLEGTIVLNNDTLLATIHDMDAALEQAPAE